MKKILMTIALAICVAGASFAQKINIDAGVAMDYSDGYDDIAFGGAVNFDYVLPSDIAIFSNTDFAFGSGSPNFVIAEILGAGYRFSISENMYLQAGGGLALVFFDHDVESISGHTGEGDTMYGEFGPALAVKFGIKFTDAVGMNFGVDAIFHPVNIFQDNDEVGLDPESHLSVIPKVCVTLSF